MRQQLATEDNKHQCRSINLKLLSQTLLRSRRACKAATSAHVWRRLKWTSFVKVEYICKHL